MTDPEVARKNRSPGKRIAIIQGHPDNRRNRFCHALESAYAGAARDSGHEVRIIVVAGLDFPLLRNKDDWESGTRPESIRAAQDDIACK